MILCFFDKVLEKISSVTSYVRLIFGSEILCFFDRVSSKTSSASSKTICIILCDFSDSEIGWDVVAVFGSVVHRTNLSRCDQSKSHVLKSCRSTGRNKTSNYDISILIDWVMQARNQTTNSLNHVFGKTPKAKWVMKTNPKDNRIGRHIRCQKTAEFNEGRCLNPQAWGQWSYMASLTWKEQPPVQQQQ